MMGQQKPERDYCRKRDQPQKNSAARGQFRRNIENAG